MPSQDLKCPFCPKVSTRGTGLASHVRGAHSSQYAAWAAARKSGASTTTAVSVAAPKAAATGTASSGLSEVIALLKQQGAAIEAALTALRAVGSPAFSGPAAVAPVAAPVVEAKSGGKKRRMSPEGRANLIAALKRRWAKAKGGSAAAPAVAQAPRKRGRPRKVQTV